MGTICAREKAILEKQMAKQPRGSQGKGKVTLCIQGDLPGRLRMEHSERPQA